MMQLIYVLPPAAFCFFKQNATKQIKPNANIYTFVDLIYVFGILHIILKQYIERKI